MRSVVFCSSQRFSKELRDFINRLKELALAKNMHIVILEPEFGDMEAQFTSAMGERERLENDYYKMTVAGKVYDHLFRKVRIADVCFVFNKDGYLGVNTTGELFAAAMAGKLCFSLHPKTLMGTYPHDLYDEPSSRKLIHEVIETPEELLKRLL